MISHYFGFDCFTYPKEAFMKKWWPSTPLWFVGFRLAPAPCHRPKESSWMPASKETTVRMELEKVGWSPVPLYFGRQENTSDFKGEPCVVISSDIGAAAMEGTKDATGTAGAGWQSAVALGKLAGFPVGTVIFLDVEKADPIASHTIAYVQAWVNAITADKYYKAGIYCPGSSIKAVVNGIAPATAKMWVYQPSGECGVPAAGMDPLKNGSDYSAVTIWQYKQVCLKAVGVLKKEDFTLGATSPPEFDLNVATSRNPSEDSLVSQPLWYAPFRFLTVWMTRALTPVDRIIRRGHTQSSRPVIARILTFALQLRSRTEEALKGRLW
ncbi:MAG: DUF1906 domain-containing protein [Actinobacteria bacterium]|nr:DUF1906 domain-containing protein [Actinomycetota bacterium]